MNALSLSACGSVGREPWQPAVDPVGLAEINAHCRAFALEQGGVCKSPVLDRVLDSTVEAKASGGSSWYSVCLPPIGRRGVKRRLPGAGERVFRIVEAAPIGR